MHFISFLVLLILFIILYTVIVEVFTILLRMTGITAEKARTQVISLLTNSGYTTNESEVVLASRKRRRIAQVIMICGYSFTVLIVSVLVNLFLAMKISEVRSLMPLALLLLACMVIILLIMRLDPVRSRFDQSIERVSSRMMYGKNANVLVLIDIHNDMAMFEVLLEHVPPFLDNVPLGKSGLKEDHRIQILSVSRPDEPLVDINGDSMLKTGDALILYGEMSKIRSAFGHLGTNRKQTYK